MAQFAVDVQLSTDELGTRAPRPVPQDAWQLVTIDWGDNSIVGFVNRAEAVAGTPDGLVINNARIAPDGMKRPKREGNIDSGVVPMQTVKVKFQDKGRALARLTAEKRANGVGVRGKVMRLYEWDAGDDVDLDADLVGTYRLDDRQWLDGYRTLNGIDIRRQLKESIFEPESYRLIASIGIDTTTITLKLPYEFSAASLPTLYHDQRYSSDPNESVFYVKTPSGEIIKCPALTANAVSGQPYHVRVTNCTRGALNTANLIEAVTVDAGTEDDNLPEFTEWVYLEETLPNLIKMITTGTSFDNRPVPDHWTISMDAQWLDTSSLLYAAPDLASLPLRAENYGKVTVKELIEDEILPFVPGTLLVNAFGQIQLRRITTIKSVGPDRHRFDDRTLNRTSLTAVRTKVSHIKSAIGIRAGWDARTETYSTPILFGDGVQQAANDSTNDAEALILDSKLLHSSIQTNAQIRRLLPAMAEHYLGEKIQFEIKAKPSTGIVDIGNRAHVSLTDVPDDAALDTLAGDISRSMLVTSLTPSQTGTLYQFTGTNGQGANYYEQLTAPVLAYEEYTRGAVALTDDLPSGAIVETNGIYYLQPGTYPLSFRKKYVFEDGPLYHTTGSTITCASGEEGPMFQLWVPHAWHSDSPTTVVTSGKGGGGGGAPGEVGAGGFAVPTVGTGSLSAVPRINTNDSGTYQIEDWSLVARAGAQSESYSSGDMPSISLSYNDGALVGLPADLSGYAGVGGGETTLRGVESTTGDIVKTTHAGGTGAAKSAGIFIMCQGATMAPAARFVVSGEAGDAPSVISIPSTGQDLSGMTFYNQAGSGSGPASVIIGMDGPFTEFDISAHVDAYPGETFYQGTHMAEARVDRARGVTHHSHYRALDHTINLSPICSRILSMPPAATVQEGTLFGVDLAFQNQRDNLIKLIPYNTVLPSSGNPGDLAVSNDQLAGSDQSPLAYIRNNNNEWELFPWATSPVRTAYVQLLSNYRDTGGTEFYNDVTRPTTFGNDAMWKDPTTRITWRLQKFGPPDVFMFVDDTETSDNRFKDSEFTNQILGGNDWVIRDDISTLPQFALDQNSVAIGPTIISIKFGGSASASESINYLLSSVNGVGVVVNGSAGATVSFNEPSDTSELTGYEIRRNGTLITTLSVGTDSYNDTGLTASTSYTYVIRAVNATERGPDSAGFTITTDPANSVSNNLDPVTGLNGSVYSRVALELFWSPPNSPGAGDGYEIYRDGVLVASRSGIATNSYFESGLMPGTTYNYAVRVVGGGERSDDATLSVTTNA